MKIKKILIGISICLVVLTMTGAAQRPTVIITFDDGWLSVHDKAYPIMQTNNQTGVAFVYIAPITGGYPDFMQQTQLNRLYGSGWDISSHTYSHLDLTTANNTTLNYELTASRGWLNTNGYPRGSMFLAYPEGKYNGVVIDAVKLNNYVAARTIELPNSNYMHYNLSSPDIFKIKSYETIGGQDNDATVMNQINNTIKSNGLLILSFHKIVDTLSGDATNAQTEFTTSDFRNVSNYLKSRSVDIEVRTLSDYFGIKPDITYPTPKATDTVISTPVINPVITAVVTSAPVVQTITKTEYVVERIPYYKPDEGQRAELITPKPTETPNFNTVITSGRWSQGHNEDVVNVSKEKDKGIIERIIDFFRSFLA